MKLTLTDDDGVIIERWESDDRPEVFRSLAFGLREIFAIRGELHDAIMEAVAESEDEIAPEPQGVLTEEEIKHLPPRG